MLRMNTPASPACACMRTRSPRIAPPVNGLVGSTATTPTVRPAARSSRDQPIDERALARAGRPGDADEIRAAGVRRRCRRIRSRAGRRLVFDERDRARDARADRRRGRARTASRRGHWAEQLARDDEPLDLARALADGEELDVAEVLLGRIVLDEAVAAVDLDAVVGGLAPRSRSRTAWPSTTRASCARRGPSGTRRDRSAAAPLRSASRCRPASTGSPGTRRSAGRTAAAPCA